MWPSPGRGISRAHVALEASTKGTLSAVLLKAGSAIGTPPVGVVHIYIYIYIFVF